MVLTHIGDRLHLGNTHRDMRREVRAQDDRSLQE